MPTSFQSPQPSKAPVSQVAHQTPPPLKPDPYRLGGRHEREHGGAFVQPHHWGRAEEKQTV